MPKRKRPHNEPEVIDSSPGLLPGRALDIQERQVEQKIAIGKKALNRALKLAKGFERQKLGRRLKAAEAEGDVAGVTRFTSEVEVLKLLNLPMLAEVHIYKTLAKSRPISSASAFLHRISAAVKANQTDGDDQKTQQDRVKNNVTARLYNSNPVKEVMADILKAVRTSLGQGVIGEYRNPQAQKPQDVNVQASSSSYSASKSSSASEDMDTITESGFGGKERPSFDKVTGVSSSEGEQTGISKYENRIVDIKGKENGFDHSNMEDDGKGVVQGRGEAVLNPKTDLSLSPPPLQSFSTTSSLRSQKHRKSPTVPKSTFLPSLMGGYWSGSESAEDESAGLQPQKNRMGQRARRQLWEKKFGMKANHLRGTVRDKDWDSKKGAKTADNRGGPRPARNDLRGIEVKMKSPGKSRATVSISESPLHPSWEAAKKAKRQAMQATFQGKKIVFD